ncbi:Suppressor of cytokine signaling 1 [Fukomys damarensis]|uniref:Suppressor of cytokine signaling 1 n=2 Tax=Fukomys damarensis TaxID=885580 RepID=A0A091CPK6_FUKDA|nr:Suppressor of cytokine signaling 1 [Fukomys damarensis]
MASGPTSIRVHFQAGRFHLDGSRESFDCLFELLEHYVACRSCAASASWPPWAVRTWRASPSTLSSETT